MEKPACSFQEICKQTHNYKLMICSYGKWSMMSKVPKYFHKAGYTLKFGRLGLIGYPDKPINF